MRQLTLFTAKPRTLLGFWVTAEDLENFKQEIVATKRLKLFGHSYEAFVGGFNDYPINMEAPYITIRYRDVVYFHVYDGRFLTLDDEGTLKCYSRKFLDIHFDERHKSQKLLIDKL